MHDILKMLKGGDRRSIGRVDEVVEKVLADHGLFNALFQGMLVTDPVVVMRAADAVEKLTQSRPEWLQPYKQELMELASVAEQQEIRWHLAQMMPRLKLSNEEVHQLVDVFRGYLSDTSKIVQTFSLQALADLTEQDESILSDIIGIIRDHMQKGSPAVKARGRKILTDLAKHY